MTVKHYLHHQWLATRRSSMFLMGVLERVLMGFTLLMLLGALFVGGYFMETFNKSALPQVTSFTILTAVLNMLLVLDLTLRPLAAGKLNTPVRPYLFLMVPKNNLARFIMFDYFAGEANVIMVFSLFGLGWLVFLRWPFPLQSISLIVYFLLMLVMNTNLKIIISRLLLVNSLFRFLVIGIEALVFAGLTYFGKIDVVEIIKKPPHLTIPYFLIFSLLFVLLNGVAWFYNEKKIAKVLYIE